MSRKCSSGTAVREFIEGLLACMSGSIWILRLGSSYLVRTYFRNVLNHRLRLTSNMLIIRGFVSMSVRELGFFEENTRIWSVCTKASQLPLKKQKEIRKSVKINFFEINFRRSFRTLPNNSLAKYELQTRRFQLDPLIQTAALSEPSMNSLTIVTYNVREVPK